MPEKKKVVCLQCGTTNNYPLDAPEKTVVCGRCKTPLPVPGTVLEPSPEQLSTLFRNSGLALLVDFYSDTCAPCRFMHPVVESLAGRRPGELMVIRIDVDLHPRIAAQFGVMAVPTFIILDRGHERGRTSGAMSEMDFALWVATRT